MEELRITGRIYSVGNDFLAVVSAVPAGSRNDRTDEHMTRICTSHPEAVEALKRMSVALGRQVLERGHQITAVDLDDAGRDGRAATP